MIETDKRKAVLLLHQEGQSAREIARLLGLSRNTVQAIIGQGGAPPLPHPRADKQPLDEELLRRLYQECQGHIARVHEKLVEEEGVAVAYSTLTHRLRELGISAPPKTRCQHVPDEPGVEMQHDTSVYQVELAGRRARLIASLIYLRYSKRRYLKFYRAFDRFRMKCFFHQALTFWGYAAGQ
jgi:transposase